MIVAFSEFIQVGINLGDPVYRGIYHGKEAHKDDLDEVLQRAVEAGCLKLMVTGSDLVESQNAIKIAREHRMCSSGCVVVACFSISESPEKHENSLLKRLH